MESRRFDVAVIGGGPSGLAAAISAEGAGASVILIDREHVLGGILKQCIHDGFGLQRFGRQMSGPSYAQKFIDRIRETSVEIHLLSFVYGIFILDDGSFNVLASSREGVLNICASSVIVATGCRERTSRQVGIHGDRLAGVFNAGCIQNLVNLSGLMPGHRCAVLGSGDIGLIMARRLTLEGAEVIGVFEAKKTPSGLQRNIRQCLDDFSIPLHLGCTVTRTIGDRRLKAIEIADTDDQMRPIASTTRVIPCDSLIVSVGLIPEIEILKELPARLDPRTKGPVVDQNGMTTIPGLFCCGNASLVYDLVDYVSMASEQAGKAAAKHALSSDGKKHRTIELETEGKLMFVSPGIIDLSYPSARLFFRSCEQLQNMRIEIVQNDNVIMERDYDELRPPQMETLVLDTGSIDPSLPIVAVLKEGEA